MSLPCINLFCKLQTRMRSAMFIAKKNGEKSRKILPRLRLNIIPRKDFGAAIVNEQVEAMYG